MSVVTQGSSQGTAHCEDTQGTSPTFDLFCKMDLSDTLTSTAQHSCFFFFLLVFELIRLVSPESSGKSGILFMLLIF